MNNQKGIISRNLHIILPITGAGIGMYRFSKVAGLVGFIAASGDANVFKFMGAYAITTVLGGALGAGAGYGTHKLLQFIVKSYK